MRVMSKKPHAIGRGGYPDGDLAERVPVTPLRQEPDMNEQVREGDRRRQGSAAPRQDPCQDPCADLTGEWASALAATGAGAAGSPGLAGVLRPLAARVLGIAAGVPFQPQCAAGIGAALVEANVTGSEALGRTLTVIGRHLARAGEAPGSTRVSALLEALAGGYVRALVSYQRRHDPLTGLANRALFLDTLAAALSGPSGPSGSNGAAGRIGVCSLDLDGFKPINDTFGPAVGDGLLVAVARRLAVLAAGPAAGSSATLARTGGDEFTLLVTDAGGTDALVALAREILTRIEQPFTVGGHRLCITACVGIAERPAAGISAADVVRDAGRALRWARADGPGRWAVYDPARQAGDAVRLALTASMRSALDAGQFSVLYQPIVQLPSGQLRGLEALLRWHHPTLGMLSPEAFIALAEESGVITPIGQWVMRTACRQAAEWHRLHPGTAPVISVNLSPQQAQDPGFVGEVARVIAETGLPPHLLQLELTESALVEADSRPLETLQKLSAMGVRIAADDFGSGYSNLAYLRRLPVDALKLSAPFIREVWPDGPADEPIIAALAALAHTLGLEVTVEGVETSEQARQLAVLGCDTAQGWYFAPAVPGDQVTAVLRGAAQPRFPLTLLARQPPPSPPSAPQARRRLARRLREPSPVCTTGVQITLTEDQPAYAGELTRVSSARTST
jgi:diguanylate cyclase (GGDEF)-like protein